MSVVFLSLLTYFIFFQFLNDHILWMNVVQRISHKQRPNSGKQTNNLSNKYECLNEGKIKGTVHQKKPK